MTPSSTVIGLAAGIFRAAALVLALVAALLFCAAGLDLGIESEAGGSPAGHYLASTFCLGLAIIAAGISRFIKQARTHNDNAIEDDVPTTPPTERTHDHH